MKFYKVLFLSDIYMIGTEREIIKFSTYTCLCCHHCVDKLNENCFIIFHSSRVETISSSKLSEWKLNEWKEN